MTDPARNDHDVRSRSSGPGRSRSKKELDDWLDEALADTFPASDPVASPPGSRPAVEAPDRVRGDEDDERMPPRREQARR